MILLRNHDEQINNIKRISHETKNSKGHYFEIKEEHGEGYCEYLGDLETCYLINGNYKLIHGEQYSVISNEKTLSIGFSRSQGSTFYKGTLNPILSIEGLHVFATPSGTKWEANIAPGSTISSFCMIFREKFFQGLHYSMPAEIWDELSKDYNYKTFNNVFIVDILNQLQNIPFENDMFKIYLHGKACELLVHLLHAYHANTLTVQKISESDRQTIYEAKTIIDQNFISPISVNELAKRVFLNKNKLQEDFKAITTMTIGAYIRQVRVEKSLDYLVNENYTVDEIAKLIGYKSTMSYYNSFEKAFNMTPNEYRKNILYRKQKSITTPLKFED